ETDPAHRPYGADGASDLRHARAAGAWRSAAQLGSADRSCHGHRCGHENCGLGGRLTQQRRGDMMERFEGRVAIVTGAAQGIGRAIAERLAQERATVAVVDINGEGAEAVAKKLGGKAIAVTCDIGDPASVTVLHKAVVDKAGKLDVTVNAGAIVPF